MTEIDQEEFRWAYSICRIDTPNAPPIQFFDRLTHAKAQLKVLQETYPDVPFSVYFRGDQSYLGNPAVHENVH